MSDIFISYRREDTADMCGRIYDRLAVQFGASRIYKDVDNVPSGYDFRSILRGAIVNTKVVVVLIGSQWLAPIAGINSRRIDDPNDFVRNEIEIAFEHNVAVLPLLIRGITMPSPDQLPSTVQPIAYCNALPVRNDPDFNVDMGRVIKAIEDLLIQAKANEEKIRNLIRRSGKRNEEYRIVRLTNSGGFVDDTRYHLHNNIEESITHEHHESGDEYCFAIDVKKGTNESTGAKMMEDIINHFSNFGWSIFNILHCMIGKGEEDGEGHISNNITLIFKRDKS